MRIATLGQALLTISIACTGCSSGGDGGGGSGGTGGSGSNAPLSFDAETSLPATGGAAAVTAFATQFGNTVSSIFEALVSAPGAASFGVSQKINLPVPGFCGGDGTAILDFPSFFPETWVENDVVALVLDNCAGSVIAAAAVSGDITLTISGVTVAGPASGPSIGAAAVVNLTISPGTEISTEITGAFEVLADVSVGFLTNGRINFRLGAQRDEDLLTVTEGGQVLRLGCFDIDLGVSKLDPDFIAPLGVADLAGQIYTVNDYAQMPSSIFLDENGVPTSGELTLFSGDQSEEGGERSGPCFGAFDGGTSQVTATFFDGGCIELNGVDAEGQPFQTSTSWEKLLDRDFTAGGGESCDGGGTGGSGGSGGPTPAEPPPVACAQDERWVAYADAYVRGGVESANMPHGNDIRLLVKGDPGLNFARKTYMVFDLSSAPEGFTIATLILTLDRHVDRQPADLSGIIDNDDWDPVDPAEGAITWNNAPRNDLSSGIAFLGQGNGPAAGVRVLAPGYTFDRPNVPGDPDPQGTQYAFDVTDFMLWADGRNESFSSSSPGGDDDEMVTLLLALSAEGNADGSSLDSRDVPDEEMCNRPFLHFE